MTKQVTPRLGLESYSCPHCGALSHQTWYQPFIKMHEKDDPPRAFFYSEERAQKLLKQHKDDDGFAAMETFFARAKKNVVFEDQVSASRYLDWYLVNCDFGKCYSCGAFSIWVRDRLVYPTTEVAILPHEDTPPLIAEDFKEAAQIVDDSPRGAAALLRLAIQKLVGSLGADADNLNIGIGELVKRGLDQRIQKALDVVRVIGNNAVHPGQIDLKDDKGTAMQLFSIVNVIVQSTISTQKQIDTLYGTLPPGALEGIEKRDKDDPR